MRNPRGAGVHEGNSRFQNMQCGSKKEKTNMTQNICLCSCPFRGHVVVACVGFRIQKDIERLNDYNWISKM